MCNVPSSFFVGRVLIAMEASLQLITICIRTKTKTCALHMSSLCVTNSSTDKCQNSNRQRKTWNLNANGKFHECWVLRELDEHLIDSSYAWRATIHMCVCFSNIATLLCIEVSKLVRKITICHSGCCRKKTLIIFIYLFYARVAGDDGGARPINLLSFKIWKRKYANAKCFRDHTKWNVNIYNCCGLATCSFTIHDAGANPHRSGIHVKFNGSNFLFDSHFRWSVEKWKPLPFVNGGWWVGGSLAVTWFMWRNSHTCCTCSCSS